MSTPLQNFMKTLLVTPSKHDSDGTSTDNVVSTESTAHTICAQKKHNFILVCDPASSVCVLPQTYDDCLSSDKNMKNNGMILRTQSLDRAPSSRLRSSASRRARFVNLCRWETGVAIVDNNDATNANSNALATATTSRYNVLSYPRRRSNSEDSITINDDANIFIIEDGHQNNDDTSVDTSSDNNGCRRPRRCDTPPKIPSRGNFLSTTASTPSPISTTTKTISTTNAANAISPCLSQSSSSSSSSQCTNNCTRSKQPFSCSYYTPSPFAKKNKKIINSMIDKKNIPFKDKINDDTNNSNSNMYTYNHQILFVRM